MKKNKVRLSILLLITTAIFSIKCADDASPVVIEVTSEQMLNNLNAGDKVLFTINAYASSGELQQLTITEKSLDYGSVPLYDTVLSGVRAYIDFYHEVKSYRAQQKVTLAFSVSNAHRDVASTNRYYVVLPDGQLLQELSGNTMYTAVSGKVDGYNLKDTRLLMTTITPDSVVDLYAYQDSTDTNNFTLSRIWHSKTGLKFVRYNDFNYASATRKNVLNAYLSGNPLEILSRIANDDIVLIGRGATPLGVLKIIAVFDDDGIMNDRYVFNVKLIE